MRNVGLYVIVLNLSVVGMGFCEKIQTDFTFSSEGDDDALFTVAYRTAFELGTGESVDGNDEQEKADLIKDMILAQESGYPERIRVSKKENEVYQVSANFVPNRSIRNNPKATRELVRAIGNPRIVINISEKNLGQEVQRSKAEAQLEKVFIKYGYRILNFPTSYLGKLEARKKALEIRRTDEVDVAISGIGTNVRIEGHGREYILDYTNLVLGSGNDQETLETAKEIKADIIVVAGAYTTSVQLTPAAQAWIEQGYKKARAYVNIQAMIVATQELVYSNSIEIEDMDFSDSGAGNKALAKAAESIGNELVFDILDNIQVREIHF